eukprot:scaffold11350_cov18-Tisochrysis_lutea.AAC.1
MQVQVDHPRHIKVPVKRLWRLFKLPSKLLLFPLLLNVQKATPQHAWEDVAVSLACLESLYRCADREPVENSVFEVLLFLCWIPDSDTERRVEFSQAAEECIAAYNAANSAPVPADAEAKGVQQQQGGEQAGDEVAAAASAAVKAVTTAVAAATNSGANRCMLLPLARGCCHQYVAAGKQWRAIVVHTAATEQMHTSAKAGCQLRRREMQMIGG